MPKEEIPAKLPICLSKNKSNGKLVSPFSHQITSVDHISHFLSQRKEIPGFLMLACEFRNVNFHPNDPRVVQFFDVFGPTIIQLKLKNSTLSNEVLKKYFQLHGNKNLASFAIKIKQSEFPCLFKSIENSIPIILSKLGALCISGMNFQPHINDIADSCPNLLELQLDTLVDFSPRSYPAKFEKLKALQLRSHRLTTISEIHIEALGKMNLKSVKVFHLMGVSYNVPPDNVNEVLESLGHTLEDLLYKMADDVPKAETSRSKFRGASSPRSRISAHENHNLPSPFPLRLPILKKLSTNVDFRNESKLFKTLPLLGMFRCNGTLLSVSNGIFPRLRKLDLRMADDSLLLDMYRSFPNLVEVFIANGESITDVGIVGNKSGECDSGAKSICTLKHLKKFWSFLSSNVTDISVQLGFAKCLKLEELGLSNSHISTESMKTIKKELVFLKELQIRKCVNIPYLDVIRLFHKNGEKKIKVCWS